jgi:hypothetical protein
MSGVRPYRSASLKRNRGRVCHSLKTYRLYEAGKDHRNNGVIGVARGAFGARGARGGGRGRAAARVPAQTAWPIENKTLCCRSQLTLWSKIYFCQLSVGLALAEGGHNAGGNLHSAC